MTLQIKRFETKYKIGIASQVSNIKHVDEQITDWVNTANLGSVKFLSIQHFQHPHLDFTYDVVLLEYSDLLLENKQ